MFKTLFSQIKQYKWPSIATPVFTALEVVMDVLIPYVTASLIDRGINAGDISQVYFYGTVMIGMAFLSLFFGIMAGRFSALASSGFAANLRTAMYRNIQRFAFSDIDKYSASGLVTRMTTDVSNLQNAYQQLLRVTVRAPFRLVLSIVMCIVINPKLSIIFVVALVVLGSALSYIIVHASRLFTQVFKAYDRLNLAVQENVSAIRVVKAFVREEYENEKFDKAATWLYQLNVKAEKLMALNNPIMNMVVYGCIIALSWFGAHYVVESTLTTGELTSLFTYVMSILQALMMLSMIFVMLTQSAASGQRVAQVINELPDIQNPAKPVMEVADGSVEFNHVQFSYNRKIKEERAKGEQEHLEYAINGLDFRIKSGETVGIIGGTGSGKSSLVNLISRLYDVSHGSVFVGGKDVRSYDLTTLRNGVSVVLQSNILFSGTILDNLRWGKSDATLEEAREACRMACADDFISEMPEGYMTHIEQGGTNVSGGQKQRLCIARALLKQPKILVLDDSTSACDTATDARIRQNMRKAMPGMTKLLISQRISTVKDCDRILVLDNGHLSAFGTHDELLKTNKVYQEIYELQDSDTADFDKKE